MKTLFCLMTLLVVTSSPLLASSDEPPNASRDAARWEADGLLHHGELSPIDAAFQKRDLRELWYYFDMAASRQYGYGRTQKEALELRAKLSKDDLTALNNSIRSRSGQYIAQIPGHAKMLGDEIDVASDTPASNDGQNDYKRIHNLLALSRLGSPEAIQQIARFLYDERNPNVEINRGGSDYAGPMPNWFHAVYALDDALGKKSPLEGKRPASTILKPEQTRALQDWWRSDASLAFRQPLPGVPLPEWKAIPYKRTRPPKPDTTSEGGSDADEIWIWVACAAGLLLVIEVTVWRARARRRASR